MGHKNGSVGIFVGMVICVQMGCGAGTKGTNPSQGCSSGIEYQGRSFNLDASYKMLGISVGSQKQAMREVSDTMKIYFEEAANLCSLYDRGELTAAEYSDRRAALSERFATLVSVVSEAPVDQVSEEETPLFVETVTALRKTRPESPTGMTLEVVAEGKVIKSGAVMKSGQGLRLRVDVHQRSYLYVVLVDSSGGISRLYPAALTGTDNPVEGIVGIPADPDAELSLDNKPGTERILAFVQQEKSPAIETALKAVEMRDAGHGQSTKSDALTRGLGVRKKLQKKGTSTAGQIVSDFGMAVTEFVIDHR
jgi:hypothetical protein